MSEAAKLFLTHEELKDLTGYTVGAKQIEWLKSRRWLYETSAAGAPKVARAHFERKMVGKTTTDEPGPPKRHNFSALQVVK